MASRERPIHRGSRLAREGLATIGRELRVARTDRGLSCAAVAAAAGTSASSVSRIERGRSDGVAFRTLVRLGVVVGLDLSLRAFPGPSPLRDAGHARLLADFHSVLPSTVHWASEVPFPRPGDLRAWDALLWTRVWRFGVEAETGPRDAQALARRLQLKERDGLVDGVLLVVRESRRVRDFLAAAWPILGPAFPVPARQALASLRAGRRPAANAVIVVPYRHPTESVASGDPSVNRHAVGERRPRLPEGRELSQLTDVSSHVSPII